MNPINSFIPFITNIFLGKNLNSIKKSLNQIFRSKTEIQFFYCLEDPYSHLLAQILPKIVKTYKLDLIIIPISSPNDEARPNPELQDRYALYDAQLLTLNHDANFPNPILNPGINYLEGAKKEIIRAKNIQDFIAIGKQYWCNQPNPFPYNNPEPTLDFTNYKLKENLSLLNNKGHYLGGTLFYQGEWFWGLDRIPNLINLLNQVLKKTYTLENFLKKKRSPPPHSPIKEIDFYFSFRSPYSYIALHKLERLKEKFNFKINYRPILPMVMRGLPVPFAKKLYIVHDANRIAKSQGIPFGKLCDPVGAGIRNTLALWPLAQIEKREVQFLFSFFNGIWSEGFDVSNKGHLKKLLERCDLSWEEAKPYLNNTILDQGIENNRQDLFALGLWGVPSFKVGGRHYWGQDRIDYFKDQLAPK